MQNSEIENIIRAELDLSELHVSGDGSHFQVIAVGDLFEGMSRVKKQQTLNKLLAAKIADGSMHALTVKAFTPQEWEKQRLFHQPNA